MLIVIRVFAGAAIGGACGLAFLGTLGLICGAAIGAAFGMGDPK